MISHAPAPVEERRSPGTTANIPRKRLGLVAMHVASDHPIAIGGVTVLVRARDPETVRGAAAKFICLNPRCVGKEWDTLTLMYAGHPNKSAMERNEETHVYGQWSSDPVDAGAVEVAQKKLVRTEASRDAIVGAKGGKVASEAEIDAAEARVAEAKAALARASAPLGLIAPPELRAEDA